MKLFLDLFVWLGIAFPILTGGLWIKKPGLKLEHTQTAVPVLLFIAIVLVLRFYRQNGSPFELNSLSSIRFFKRIWNFWVTRFNRSPRQTVFCGAIPVAFFFALAALRRHWAFESNAYDLGIFTNALWNLSNGFGYFSAPRGGINLLTDHQSFIAWILSPLFNLAPYPETLLILQALGLSFAALPATAIALQTFQPPSDSSKLSWALPAIPILFWSYPPLRFANSFDFHPEAFMPLFFLCGVAGLQSTQLRNRWIGFFCLLIALLTKETAAFLMAGFSIAWALGAGPKQGQTTTRKLGLPLLALSIGFAIFDLKTVPNLLGQSHFHLQAQMKQYGEGPLSLLLSPVLQPALFWKNIFGPARITFLFFTLAPLAFLPLLAGRAALVLLPPYLILFLTGGDHKVSQQYHYGLEPAIALFWTLPLALKRIAPWPRLAQWLATPTCLLGCALVFFGRSEIYRIRKFSPTPQQKWISQTIIPSLSTEAFSASTALVPQIANRHWVHEIPRLEMHTPESRVSCVLIDGEVNNWSIAPSDWTAFYERLKAEGYQELLTCKTTRLFEKKGSNPCLLQPVTCPTEETPK